MPAPVMGAGPPTLVPRTPGPAVPMAGQPLVRVGVPGGSRVGDTERVLLRVVIAAVVVLQRFALPFGDGQVPLVLPVVLVAVVWAVGRGVLEEDRLRLQLYLAAMLACGTAATIASWRGLAWSPLSLIYLFVTYLPFSFRLRRASPELHREAVSFFVKLMTAAAVLGIVQMGAQLLGWAYHDPFEAIPSSFVLQGYNTSYSVVYGSPIFKANGFLFLEPSFYSQFLALALIGHLYLRRRPVAAGLFLAALLASVSGTGVVLAASGSVLLGLTRHGRQIWPLLSIGVMAVIVALSPIGTLFTSRIAEFSTGKSSADGRFVAPYRLASATLFTSPATLLTGNGPGSAERLAREVEERTGLTPVFPVVPKLAVEYGEPAAAGFLLFVLVAVLRRVPSVPLSLAVLVMYLTLSGSLLQPATVFLMLVFTTLFASDHGQAARDPSAEDMSGGDVPGREGANSLRRSRQARPVALVHETSHRRPWMSPTHVVGEAVVARPPAARA